MNIEKVLTIMAQAKTEKWPFPKTFDALKEADVKNYIVSWKNGYHSQINFNDNSSFNEETPSWFVQPQIADKYLEKSAKDALLIHQAGKTTYSEWLKEMAQAGVANYIVNMSDRTVVYFTLNKEAVIVENVPLVK